MIIRSFARAVTPPFLLLLAVTCSYGNQNQEFIKSCGDIHNITFPFQLLGDPSYAARDQYFSLSCDQNNRTVLDLSAGKYYVQSMNYTDYSIRLVDVGIQTDDICSSFPLSSLTPGDFLDDFVPYFIDLVSSSTTVLFLSCENPLIQSPAYINRTGYCITGDGSGNGYYSYVVVGEVTLWDFPDSCLLDKVAISSSPRLISGQGLLNLSWLDLNRELAYGFEATWYSLGTCKQCKEFFYNNDQTTDSSVACGDCKFEPPLLSE